MSKLYSAEDLEFRDEVRAFLLSEIPQHIREKVGAGMPLAKADQVFAQRKLNEKGWAVPHWPKQWGGQDWTPVQEYILNEELQRCSVPVPLPFNTVMIGPVIAEFGTQEQKERFLPRAANLDDWWCQGFSEPNAGSDLASLATRAERTENGYVINGQKAWTSYGHYADWMFCLVRTNPDVKKQLGISMVLIDMKTPGISIRPTITHEGRHEVNEVFFTDVEIPAENLIGEENKGWDYAKFLLSNERTSISGIGLSKQRIERARQLAKTTPAGAGMLWDSEEFRARVLAVEVELKALEVTQLGVLARMDGGSNGPDPASSILKIRGSQLQQASAQLLMEVAGPEGLRVPTDVSNADISVNEIYAPAVAVANYMSWRKVSIYGGSNEIQRTIIAKTLLDL